MATTFLQLQQDLANQVGLDQTISSNAALLKRWLNKAQQRVLRAYEWPFNRSVTPLVVQTVTDYTTGTVATILGSVTITFSVAPTVSFTNRYIQTSSTQDWYRITAHTANTTTATIEIGALATASAATLTVRKIYYSTDATVDKIVQMTQTILPYQLAETSPEYFQSFNPGFLSTGSPRVYLPDGVDANGFPQFKLWPNPDAIINLSIYYLKVGVDMSLDGDLSVIPEKWRTSVLVDGAQVEAFEFLDDSRAETQELFFQKGIEEMKTEYEIGLHRHRVMTAADCQPVGGNLGYMPLPFNYPRGS